ncbi:hypothetical protein LRS74_33285 [Streptomyces sp. LX-29]|uniref:hypothetical protein n=1 Tax=Streptomyces sp. LX-29 TaxID=2900152 RepID=UPI00240E7A33|nr:hypothetical protein [Streptomyces sp. LX-29]WFB11362.1 hypothetical protein LRS74_33285 [Streptomyces sp. LX-29]
MSQKTTSGSDTAGMSDSEQLLVGVELAHRLAATNMARSVYPLAETVYCPPKLTPGLEAYARARHAAMAVPTEPLESAEGVARDRGARPVGALLAGGLGTWLGVRPSLVAGACLLVVPCVVLARSPLRALRHMPDPPPGPDDPIDAGRQPQPAPVSTILAPGPASPDVGPDGPEKRGMS